MDKVLIIGCGYVGNALGVELKDLAQAFGLRSSDRELCSPIIPLRANFLTGEGLEDLPRDFDSAVYLISARGRTERAYKEAYVESLSRALEFVSSQLKPLKRFIYVSSTGVYGENCGGEVDEDSSLDATGFTGRVVAEGERLVRSCGLEYVVARFGGIYGPGRERMLRLCEQRNPEMIGNISTFTNRIHLLDAARALKHLLFHENPPQIVNVVDDTPCLKSEVLRWICESMQIEPWGALQQKCSTEEIVGKRISNAVLKASGFELTYSSFKEGYGELLRQ